MTRTYSSAELSFETGVPTDRVSRLVGLGILHPDTPETFAYGEVFRVKIVAALLAAGFTEKQIEAAFATGSFSLDHFDRYEFGETGERSALTFDEFGSGLGEGASDLRPAIYQVFGLPYPEPSAHLPLAEESLLEDFFRIWRTRGDDDTVLPAARLVGEGTRLWTMGWPELFSEAIAAPARERWLRREIDQYPSEMIDAGVALARLLPRLALWLMDRFFEELVTSGIVANFEEVLASRGLAARVADVARPGQILVTEAVVHIADGARFEPVDAFRLEGLANPVPLFEVVT